MNSRYTKIKPFKVDPVLEVGNVSPSSSSLASQRQTPNA
jgi:hypothetical protein